MKKVTIITPPEYEGLILESLGKAGVTQLKEVTSQEFTDLKSTADSQIDYNALYQRVHSRYLEIKNIEEFETKSKRPPIDEIREFSLNPEIYIDELIEELDQQISRVKNKKEEQYEIGNKLVEELRREIKEIDAEYQKKREELINQRIELRAKIDSLQALEPEELKRCFAAGVVKKDVISQLEEYLKRYEDTFYRTTKLSEDESLIFVFGNEEARSWVESLFLVFDVKDIFNVLDSRDILLVLDPEKRKEILEKYREDLKQLEGRAPNIDEGIDEKLSNLEREHREEIADLKKEYDEKIQSNEEKIEKEIITLRDQQGDLFNKLAYYNQLLNTYAHPRANVLRGKVISVMQGYTPEKNIDGFLEAINRVEKEIDESLFVEIEDIDPEQDIRAPTSPMDFGPSMLDGLWTLTSLRGWPTAWEINPGWITVIIFSFQFGLMFGDIGQGAIFLFAGIFLAMRYKSGMMQKLGSLFIPMGISAIIFGFLYDSIFLIEGLLFHHHQILPNPIHDTTRLMLLIFQIAALEVIIALILGAINQIRRGNPIGALGEHGLGMIMYITGLYLSATYFIRIGMDFMTVLGHWTFYLMLAGMTLSFLEPVIHSLAHGHGINMESIGEGVAGLLMTFVEGLANLFSFLRIAAFALAHASLAIAAEALTNSLGIAGIGLVIMNIVALSFEFVSSSVQSLRLLYYEFMGKFYSGEGESYRPFKLRTAE
jgi:V/A-type H+-transporting ATPase subunit I